MAGAANPPVMAEAELRQRIESCPKLASLRSIHGALAQLLRNHHSQAGQFAEIIARDPSLTARLLRMVNSVYFGLGTQVGTIEEAVLYLGLRQVRSLALATPVLEEMSALGTAGAHVSWRDFWVHSLACAFATRDILNQSEISIDDDTDYITGLLQNVGKVVMAKVAPAEFVRLAQTVYADETQVLAAERAMLGWDHAAIGAHYLECHKIPGEIVEAVRFHHDPAGAPQRQPLAAATQLADGYARLAGLGGGVETRPAPTEDELIGGAAAALLWGDDLAVRRRHLRPLGEGMRRLPELVNALL
jgi:HD-like signal output (HDOD) protein